MSDDTNWWKGTCKGRTGLIPSNYGNIYMLYANKHNLFPLNSYFPLFSADIVDVLFTQANLELNQQNKLGDTALHAAAWKGYADIVEMLLAKGARTDLKNNEKKLALDMATNAACASLLKKKQTAGISDFSSDTFDLEESNCN
uniref:Osteoclast stimulating factor 1 n=1 Tax=Pavo cristatus TaxID=9049 RepID=A0A8C9F914_PAVCR